MTLSVLFSIMMMPLSSSKPWNGDSESSSFRWLPRKLEVCFNRFFISGEQFDFLGFTYRLGKNSKGAPQGLA